MNRQMGIKFLNAVESLIREDLVDKIALREYVISSYTEST